MPFGYIKVIDEILKEDLEKVHAQRARQRGRTSQKELGHFQEITILSHEWQEIKELNDELKVGYFFKSFCVIFVKLIMIIFLFSTFSYSPKRWRVMVRLVVLPYPSIFK